MVSKGKLVNQQVVAYQQGVLHGAGGDLESLNDEGGAEDSQDDGHYQ
jgi:hypothetical protein